MKPSERSAMRDMLRVRSRKIKDPAEREVEIIEDGQAIGLADECHCKVHDVYNEALALGIYPYRYLRNMEVISPLEQLKLGKSRVTVVGAGGLGGQVILLLARLGIGQLVVVDPDVFEESNLNRQALCRDKTLGKPKCEAVVAMVGSINPGVEILPYQAKLEPSNAYEFLDGSDVVVDALDNIRDRFVLEEATKKLRIPLVHGALAGFEGQMMTIFPDDQGLRHIYGKEGANGDKSKSPESVLGVPALMPTLIATFQAMEALKIILERGRVFRNAMVHLDLETGKMSEFVIEAQ